MKKITTSIVFGVIASMSSSFIAFAQPASDGRVPFEKLGGVPAVIRFNPFYGGKYLFSDIKGRLTGSKVKKADLQMTVMSQKAADLMKLSEVAPNDAAAFSDGLGDYQRSALLAASALNRLGGSDFKGDEWKSFADKAAINLQFIGDLRTKEQSNQGQAILVDLEDTLAESLVRLLVRLGAADDFADGVHLAAVGVLDGFSDLRDAELLTLLADTAQSLGEDEAAASLRTAAEFLYENVSTRLWTSVADGDTSFMPELTSLSGSPDRREKSIEHLIEIQSSLSETLLSR